MGSSLLSTGLDGETRKRDNNTDEDRRGKGEEKGKEQRAVCTRANTPLNHA